MGQKMSNRMKVYGKKEECCGCGACAQACPHGAIRMAVDREGFAYPKVKKSICRNCGICEKVCPLKGEEKVQGKRAEAGILAAGDQKGQSGREKLHERIYLGAQAREEEIRAGSSSGGVFPVLARLILSRGGVVFGAAMEKGGRVRHQMAGSLKELEALQKTKYVQSDLSGCFCQVKQLLKEGREVLFCGTPCQCQAMKRYLGGEQEKLLLVDLVCYGNPSPGIWQKYVGELEKRYGGELTAFCFRDKRAGDNGHTISVRIGGQEYTWPMSGDAYCRIYFRNYTLRPACYFCRFSSTERQSDITLGDFWGLEKVAPEMEDGMGTSLVILHNQRAERLWEEIREEFRYFYCKREEVLQPRLCGPSSTSTRRWKFMLLYRFMSVSRAEKILRRQGLR